MKHSDFILSIYQDKRTVFRLADIAMLFPEAQVIFYLQQTLYLVLYIPTSILTITFYSHLMSFK